MDHEFIVKYVDSFQKKKSKKGMPSIHILLEYCNGGSLDMILSKATTTLDPGVCYYMLIIVFSVAREQVGGTIGGGIGIYS